MPGRLLALTILVLVAVGALWFALREGDGAGVDGLAEDPPEAEAEGPDAPMLVGSQPDAHTSANSPSHTQTDGGVEADPVFRKAQKRIVTLKLRQPNGEPARLPRTDVVIRSKGAKPERRFVQLGEDGTVRIELDADATLEGLELLGYGTEGPRGEVRLFSWTAGSGVSLDAQPPIEVAFTSLPVRTVDSRGDPRPHQRILFRPVIEGKEPTGWWGESSDTEGRLVLGPFPIGSTVEMRPGWRGVRKEDLTEEALRWKRVVADGKAFELFVGDQPRLVLHFPRTGEETVLVITVLDAESGEPAFPSRGHRVEDGDFRAPALKEHRPYEIVVGPTATGLFARHRIEQLSYYPEEVTLVRVPRVEGRVSGPNAARVRRGHITAIGRGFKKQVPIEAGGRFAFTGLPDEPITYDVWAEVTDGDDKGIWFRKSVEKRGETWVEIALDASTDRRKPTVASTR
ncbi:MAG: hypothetical protein QNJ98_05750 [Planctomycetota bacterium]|nr:hypothetical protein [Planctomycetota bacterium]